jgi:hypothetical protein
MHRIAYPIGGCGNHIRWLCLLSEQYNNIDTINMVGYLIRGKMFPYDKSQKVEFIKKYVYPKERNCFNYIEYELKFKKLINILVTSNPNSCIKHYFKFHPLWNGNPWKKSGKNIFEEKTLLTNQKHINYTKDVNEEIFYLDSDVLNTDTLDEDVYGDLCNFLCISNNYAEANIVHRDWYNLQKSSEKMIIDFFKNSSYPNFPWTLYKEKYANAKVYTKEDWDEMKEIANNLYG